MNTVIQPAQNLIDQEARDRFAQEIDVNFSVIAPAGVGKTTAIVQRILSIANSCNYNILPSRLSKLVVVTYTQKAADEMRHRSYQALLKANAPPQCLQEFNKAFFGTIHSFCLKIIQSHGPQIGVPSKPELLTDDSDLWHEFLNKNDSFSDLIPEDVKDGLCKHLNLEKLSQLAQRMSPEQKPNISLPAYPKLTLDPLFIYIPKKASKKIPELQKELRHWWKEYQENPFALNIPEITQGDSDFKELCANVFSPLWNWLGDASLNFVISLAKKYQQFRIQKGFINYDDMIGLAAKLLSDPYVISVICSLDYHIILDEAQDTDAQQFSVLLRVAGSPSANTPGKGRFCMLGDPQQAIYGNRADLPTYLKIHQDLLSSQSLQTLTFNVTMRCDREIVSHCNTLFPSILKNKTAVSQTNFVPLNPRPWAQKGFVGKICIDLPENSNTKLNTNDLEILESTALAEKIYRLGRHRLGITDWSEVAILAPRRSWLTPIANAFHSLGIPTQIHSRDDIQGNNPAIAWLTALCIVINAPNDSFELTGILRDIFGISDDEIATFVHHWDSDKSCIHPINISQAQDLPSISFIKQSLGLLHIIRNSSLTLSLSEAVRNIIQEVDLKNRLASLPDYDTQKLFASLDKLLIQATLYEEQGLSFAEFTEVLKKNYYTPDDPETELKGHIQFYTSHKAKGLEWPVVIVPFLFRNILFPPQEYPQLIATGSEYAPKIAVTDHPDKEEFSLLLDQYRIAELERLLYVTATRARNTLLWIDDESLFPNSKNSFASFLKITQKNINRQTWNELNTELSIDPPKFPSDLSSNGVADSLLNLTPMFDPTLCTKAKTLSKNFTRTISPSQLNQKSELSNILKKSSKNYSPIEYGNWWHKMMETLPWHSNILQLNAHLEKSLSNCPEPSRGEFEFQLFLKSTLFMQLSGQSFNIHTELPFLFKDEQNVCYEGYIDFFAYSPGTGESLIIDWKTDLFEITENASTILRELYSPQLLIYKQAIKKSIKQNPQTFIFNTPQGIMIEC